MNPTQRTCQRRPLVAPCIVAALAALSCAAQAATFEVLHHFGGNHGRYPVGAPALTPDGDLYGTTTSSKRNPCCSGTLFRLSAASGYSRIEYLHYFHWHGFGPEGDLLADSQGHVYGTTHGSIPNDATVFEFDPDTGFERLQTLPNSDINGGLAQGPDGTLYGTTATSIFKLDPQTRERTTIHSFGANDGWSDATLTFWDGKLLGATYHYPFSFNLETGKITLHGPGTGWYYGGPIPGPDGTLWGAVNSDRGALSGGIYRIDAAGRYQVMSGFDLHVHGGHPQGQLAWGDDGNLYGTNSVDGACEYCGTVYRFDPASSTVEVLHRFEPDVHDGAFPQSGLVKDSLGRFYGVTTYSVAPSSIYGYADGWGLVYRITP